MIILYDSKKLSLKKEKWLINFISGVKKAKGDHI